MGGTGSGRMGRAAHHGAWGLVALIGAASLIAPRLAEAQTPEPAISHAAPYASAKPGPTREDAIRRGRAAIAEYMARVGVPGLSVAVSVNGVPAWSEGFGYADVEQGVVVTPSTRFRSGSTAKPMSMAAAAVLHDQGRLDFDATVQRYIPDFPVQSRPISFRMLAGHLGGFRHYPPNGDEFFNTRHFDDVTEALDTFKNDPLVAPPGTTYSYSSNGANLQGAMTQAAGGKPFLELMQTLVFGPLGMVSTGPDRVEDIIPLRARYYERTGGKPTYHLRKSSWGNGERGELLNAPYTDNSNKFPSGGYITTPEDLVKFGSAHLRPGFLKAETLKELFTSQKTADGKPTGYGMNWVIGTDHAGRSTWRHTGSSVGGNSILLIYPQAKVVLAIQTNLTDSNLAGLPEALGDLFQEEARP